MSPLDLYIIQASGSKQVDLPQTIECSEKYESNEYTDKVSYKEKDTSLIMQGEN